MRIGVLGGGQLGRMLALAGAPLNINFRFFDTNSDAPTRELGELHVGRFDDESAIDKFARGCDVVTYEFENVPLIAGKCCAAVAPLMPSLRALEISQHRVLEKSFLNELKILTAPWRKVSTFSELEAATKEIGLPAVLKTTTLGYDGKGQQVVKNFDELKVAWKALGERELIVEGFVPFERELSIIAARGLDGSIKYYPIGENVHRDGILRITTIPAAGLTKKLEEEAQGYAKKILEALGYVGVFTLELFQCKGELYANEMAPRVHNSGHWTIDGAVTSQFENHLRAIAGLPLGDTAAKSPTVMLNMVGAIPEPREILSFGNAKLHLYGKAPRPGRKVGHINILNAEPSDSNIAKEIGRLKKLSGVG